MAIWNLGSINIDMVYALPHMPAPGETLAATSFDQGLGGKGCNLSDWMSPLKLFEYMGHGKAIVCSDLPVLREVLTDGVNARLANPDAPEEWVSAIRALHSSPETRVALGARARIDFVEKYSWDRRAEHILDGLRKARTLAAEAPRGQP